LIDFEKERWFPPLLPKPTVETRNVLPRWQRLKSTPKQELHSCGKNLTGKVNASSITRFDIKWKQDKNLENAYELLEASLIYGPNTSTKDAAEYVHDIKNGAANGFRLLAETFLSEKTQPNTDVTREIAKVKIAKLKKRIIAHPHDAISSIEIARLQTTIGQNKSAKKYIERALKIAPENRYALRSSARFFWHVGEREEALNTLRQSNSLRYDPWLQASEVAFCDLLGRPAHWAHKRSRELKSRQHGDITTSELSAGLAAWELNHGTAKAAKKLFATSMKAPTENAAAQLSWTKTQELLPSFEIPTFQFQDYEAKLYQSYRNSDANGILSAANTWLHAEPYSTYAAISGSSAALSLLDLPSHSIALCERGLIANPNNFTLINNKCVAHLRLGEFTEADKLITSLKNVKTNEDNQVFVDAANGLKLFRQGKILEGRDLYIKSITTSADRKDLRLLFRAVIFWMEEEAIAGTSDLESIQPFMDIIDERIKELNRLELGFKFLWTMSKARIINQLKKNSLQSDLLNAIANPADPNQIYKLVEHAETDDE